MRKKNFYINGKIIKLDPKDIPAFEKDLENEIKSYTGLTASVKVSINNNGIEITSNLGLPDYRTSTDSFPEPLLKFLIGRNAQYQPDYWGFPGFQNYIDNHDVEKLYKKNARAIHASRIKHLDCSYIKDIGMWISLVF